MEKSWSLEVCKYITSNSSYYFDSLHFSGDFRQILPVVRRGSRADIAQQSFKSSLLWSKIVPLNLNFNMRVCAMTGEAGNAAHQFAEWLKNTGDENTYIIFKKKRD